MLKVWNSVCCFHMTVVPCECQLWPLCPVPHHHTLNWTSWLTSSSACFQVLYGRGLAVTRSCRLSRSCGIIGTARLSCTEVSNRLYLGFTFTFHMPDLTVAYHSYLRHDISQLFQAEQPALRFHIQSKMQHGFKRVLDFLTDVYTNMVLHHFRLDIFCLHAWPGGHPCIDKFTRPIKQPSGTKKKLLLYWVGLLFFNFWKACNLNRPWSISHITAQRLYRSDFSVG